VIGGEDMTGGGVTGGGAIGGGVIGGGAIGGGAIGGAGTRSGFIALAGRPNVGKSTLVNAIVGARVAIVSDRPQTTRRAIRGVATGDGWQLVIIDLPGVQRPRDALTERMQRRVERELEDADAALVVLNGEEGVGGPGDRFIAQALARAPRPVTAAVNKLDRLDRPRTVSVLAAAAELLPDAEVFPVSARTGAGLEPLVGHLIAQLPAGPFHFPAGQRSDLPLTVEVAELVREQVLARARQEVPHAVEVELEELERPRPDFVVVRARVLVESESQKAILIGAGGRMVKAIGTAARRQLEARLGARVHLDLSVRVRRRWRTDTALLDRLGIG
jgi:GTP-binding protein Era